MKKLSLFLLSLIMLISLTACDSGDYKKAKKLYERGQYSEAAAIFEGLGDYEDSSEKVKQCKYQQALALAADREFDRAIKAFTELGDYEDCTERLAAVQNEKAVVEAMEGQVWYYNGGSKTKLNSISFDKTSATVVKIVHDGNGKHESGRGSYPYEVGKKCITVKVDDKDLVINYTLKDGVLSLEKNQYLSKDQVAKGLEGYWNSLEKRYILEKLYVEEYNVYIKNGKLKFEHAFLHTDGESYDYYEPETISLENVFAEDDINGPHYYFNIIDGKPTLLHYDNVCKSVKLKKLPGFHGYKHLFD